MDNKVLDGYAIARESLKASLDYFMNTTSEYRWSGAYIGNQIWDWLVEYTRQEKGIDNEEDAYCLANMILAGLISVLQMRAELWPAWCKLRAENDLKARSLEHMNLATKFAEYVEGCRVPAKELNEA